MLTEVARCSCGFAMPRSEWESMKFVPSCPKCARIIPRNEEWSTIKEQPVQTDDLLNSKAVAHKAQRLVKALNEELVRLVQEHGAFVKVQASHCRAGQQGVDPTKQKLISQVEVSIVLEL